MTNEIKEKISIGNKGKIRTNENKNKIRTSMINKHNKKIYQIDLITNEIIKIWNSASDIEKELGFNHSNIAQCCRNKLKKSYGYKWQYIFQEAVKVQIRVTSEKFFTHNKK